MTQINIRIDDTLKKQADSLFDELGMTMTTAFNIFIHQTVREGRIPFEITTQTDPFYSAQNMKVLEQSIKEIKAGKFKEHNLIEE